MTANLYIQSMQLTDLWLVSPARLDSTVYAVTRLSLKEDTPLIMQIYAEF